MPEFEEWLRATCFQAPTPEAYDLAKCAWAESQRQQRERDIDRAFGWWAGTEDLDAIPTDIAHHGIRQALEG